MMPAGGGETQTGDTKEVGDDIDYTGKGVLGAN